MKRTNSHTLEERLHFQLNVNLELIEELKELEEQLEENKSFFAPTGMIESTEVTDLEVIVIGNILVASGKADKEYIYTVINLKEGNISFLRDDKEPSISAWQEHDDMSIIGSEQLLIDFKNQRQAKQVYKELETQLHKYHIMYK